MCIRDRVSTQSTWGQSCKSKEIKIQVGHFQNAITQMEVSSTLTNEDKSPTNMRVRKPVLRIQNYKKTLPSAPENFASTNYTLLKLIGLIEGTKPAEAITAE
eukprot:TRINITY_DN1367_c0_g1_i5.p1 TRINITY_DN1367_c0_g1~~TRINITY_DN1367_c0_g1_i5.p1  ORF type:complete len:102 (-),score=17.47 TRINITY_DN1367_c0_g1_i5:201-506(-)